MVTKNLVFSFYVFDGFEDNEAIKLHLKCLKKYSNIFDNAKFVISIKDTSNIGMIKKAESMITECGFKNLEFKVKQNDCYCEARTLKDEILDKIDTFEGLTFFAHTKGVTNVTNKEIKKESVLKWVAGMYYMNLNFIEEVESCLIYHFDCSMFGSYKVVSDKIENKNRRWYAGTFYWINTNRLSNNMKNRGIEMPKLHDSGYAEFITGELDELGTHCDVYLYPFEYDSAGGLINFLLMNDQYEIEKYKEYEKALGI
ncbi:MAG: hypothetical protein J6X18_15200 [Bacteroidales bacterium]|nr:hypothetical protein [Bacteroidales bacterium]